MSIGEIAEIVTSLGLLFTAITLCLMARYLYWIGKDLSDNRKKLYEMRGRLNGSPPEAQSREIAEAIAPIVREAIENNLSDVEDAIIKVRE